MATNGLTPIAPEAKSEDYASQVEQLRPTVPQQDKKADGANNLPLPQDGSGELSKEDAEKLTEFLNNSTSLFDLSIQFKVAEETDRIVISVFNDETDELIRQIPSQEVIDLSKRLNEMVGILFNEVA